METAESAPEPPKPPPGLPLFFMLSHLEEDGPVRLDGMKLAVCELMGLELDDARLGAFAGALNALDFPVQFLVRQHPRYWRGSAATWRMSSPGTCPSRRRPPPSPCGAC